MRAVAAVWATAQRLKSYTEAKSAAQYHFTNDAVRQ
jgi:hypothetical protein